MSVQIVTYGARVLRDPVDRIGNITDHHLKVINRLKYALANTDGYGVAAPQIGERLPIFNFRLNNKIQTLLNPEIKEFDDTLWFYKEGCLSIPGYAFPIWRPKRVLVTGVDPDGNDIELEAEDLLGRIFQHEMDHLNGILVIDHLEPSQHEEFMKKWKNKQYNSKKRKKSRK